MTNEAVKVELLGANRDGEPRSFIIASSATLAKGECLTLNDGRIASSAISRIPQACAGIANAQKTADYSATIGAWTQGVFSVVASGTVTAGYPAMCTATSAHPNTFANAITPTKASGAIIVGYFLDSRTTGQRVNMRLNL